MSELKIDKELFVALQNCKDAKEIMALTMSKGINLTEEQAGKVFEYFQDRELTDEELEQIVGGAVPATVAQVYLLGLRLNVILQEGCVAAGIGDAHRGVSVVL